MKNHSRLVAITLGIAAIGLSTTTAAQAATPPICDGRAATIVVQPGTTAYGTAGPDVIRVVNGPDPTVVTRVHGGGGDDLICGGNGEDRIWADTGNDRIFAGEGNDTIHIFDYTAGDYVHGGGGRDTGYVDPVDSWESIENKRFGDDDCSICG